MTSSFDLHFTRKTGRYTLEYNFQSIEQRVCEFLYTYSMVSSVNLEEYLNNTNGKYDFIKVPLSAGGQCLVLNITDFLKLKSLYEENIQHLYMEDMLIRMNIAVPEQLVFV